MLKKIALIGLVAMPMFSFAGGAEPQAGSPRYTPASAASAPAAQPAPADRTSGAKQHQLMAVCTMKVNAAGATGEARKQALSACLKNS